MKVYNWLNKAVGNYDLLLVCDETENEKIKAYFNLENIRIANMDDCFYYFLEQDKMIITPMPFLSLAFGGQYNDDTPIGDEVKDFNFEVENYSYSEFR